MIIRNPQLTRDCVSCQTSKWSITRYHLVEKLTPFFPPPESKIRFLQISKKTPQPLSSHTDLLLRAQSCLSEGSGALKMLLVLTLHEWGWRTSSISLPHGTSASPAPDSSPAPQPSLGRKPNLVGVFALGNCPPHPYSRKKDQDGLVNPEGKREARLRSSLCEQGHETAAPVTSSLVRDAIKERNLQRSFHVAVKDSESGPRKLGFQKHSALTGP